MQTASNLKAAPATVSKTIAVGSIAGIISVLLSNFLAWAIMAANNYQFEMLNGFSITISAFLANLIGAFIYRVMWNKSSRAGLYYAILCLVMAVLTTVNTVANPMEPNIGAVANPLHFLVAVLSLILIPVIMKRVVKG